MFCDTEGFFQPTTDFKNDVIIEVLKTMIMKLAGCLIFVIDKFTEQDKKLLREIKAMYNQKESINKLFIIHNYKHIETFEKINEIINYDIVKILEAKRNEKETVITPLTSYTKGNGKEIIHYVLGNKNKLNGHNNNMIKNLKSNIKSTRYDNKQNNNSNKKLKDVFINILSETLLKYNSYEKEDFTILAKVLKNKIIFCGNKNIIEKQRIPSINPDYWRKIDIVIHQHIIDDFLHLYIECPGLVLRNKNHTQKTKTPNNFKNNNNNIQDKNDDLETIEIEDDETIIIIGEKYDYSIMLENKIGTKTIMVIEKISLIHKIIKKNKYELLRDNYGIIILKFELN